MARASAIEQEFVRVTEAAALAAAHTMGFGDKHRSDQVAVEAMRNTLEEIDIAGRVVIGEGERDDAPMLYVGEEVGGRKGDGEAQQIDIAVDPLEGTNLCASGAPGSVAVLAAAERGGLLHAPDTYMEKIVVGPTARGAVHLDAPVPENLRNIAKAFKRDVTDLTVVVLERDRHQQLIADIRAAGSRIRLIPDGDLAAGISAAVRGTGVHAVMGIGGAPEGVITAAAMRCLGGQIQARLVGSNDAQKERLKKLGYQDLSKIYETEDLACGENLVFSCTGVTDGELLRGVRLFGGGTRTSTLYMSLHSSIIRFVETIHRDSPLTPVHFR
ncbi:MAG: class II fructose-bisphosphatase [Holophagales bacterium]|nr:class II fructose-bisphosphatase [Holophagales bacterium]